MSVSDFELLVALLLDSFLMVGGAILDDSESEASKTTITIHGEKRVALIMLIIALQFDVSTSKKRNE